MKEKLLVSVGIFIRKNKSDLQCIILSLVIYMINKAFLMEYIGGGMGEFFRWYLNDLVCPLFFLGFSRMMLKWAGVEIKSYIIYILIGIAAALMWEYVGPIINSKSVSDYKDLLCYFIGTNMYYLLVTKIL